MSDKVLKYVNKKTFSIITFFIQNKLNSSYPLGLKEAGFENYSNGKGEARKEMERDKEIGR